MSDMYGNYLLGHSNKLCNLDIVLRKYLEMAHMLDKLSHRCLETAVSM
jgi:hypothetical protein